MKRKTARILKAMASATAAVAVLGAVVWYAPERSTDAWREAALDALLIRDPPPGDGLVVVDIDEHSIETLGPWPWPRQRLADLVGRIADGQPQAIAVDIVLAGPDPTSARSILGDLPPGPEGDDIRRAIQALPDPDAELAAALARVPVALAMLLADDNGHAEPPQAPILVSGSPPPLAPWAETGAELPATGFADAAAALGVASLEDDPGGRVRRVPVVAGAGAAPVAGLAVEVLRLAQGAGSFILDGDGARFRIGDLHLPVDRRVDLRIRPSGPETWAERTVSAADVLSGAVPASRFAGAIVVLGGGAPSLGGLRATAASPVAPSMQIQADAIATIRSGRIPFRPDDLPLVETAAFVAMALAGGLAGALLGPLAAVATGGALALGWAGTALVLLMRSGIEMDPVTPALAVLLAVLAAGMTAAIDLRRQEAVIRRRFEQHLAPAVVARLLERPGMLRFEGERREVTVLATDIEGFTSLTDRIGPTELIALLDAYFTGLVGEVLKHGGMVDKFVGDAALCLFNAPIDLPDHPRHALAAAQGILGFTRRFAETEIARAAGLGRTRIGIETGEVVIGDVGGGARLDYTAYGSAMNTAARLEAMNKTFGTSICVGPECRARLPDIDFRPLGEIEVRGRGTLALFTPSDPPAG